MASTSVRRVAGMVASWSRRTASSSSSASSSVCVGVSASYPAAPGFGAAPAAGFASAAQAPLVKEAPADAAHADATAAPQHVRDLSDAAIVHLLKSGLLSPHRIEQDVGDAARAVGIRRAYITDALQRTAAHVPKAAEGMSALPMEAFDHSGFYNSILNTNCEAVIGYVPLPVGIVGPLQLDGKSFYVPLATTEGALVASTNRGCAAIRRAGGATTVITADGMTRAPLVRMPSLTEAAALKTWLDVPENFAAVAAAFNSTSRFGRLKSLTAVTAGRNVYLRFKAATGDAMGMNMITKGVNEALAHLHKQFPAMRVLSLSGNFCTDKKPSAVNWIEGRGKTVSAEVRLSGHVLKTVLKTTADAMVELNTAKNLVGSAMAGSIGGFNAHASNIVTAVFLATGQDGAQNVESSTCLTLMEKDTSIVDPADPEGKAGAGLVMTVNMPSVEVGTVGGGTSLPAQAACLELLGLRGSSSERPGANAQQLARVVAGSVLAGELSLMSALTTNDLLKSHMKLNRKHGDASSGPQVSAVTSAMMTKLAELKHLHTLEQAAEADAAAAAAPTKAGHVYTTVYTPASKPAHIPGSSATSNAGSVPGGAPAGSHPHPLHMSGPTVHSSAASPGRRYFAAPTSRVSRFGGHAGVTSVTPASAWAPAVPAAVDPAARAAAVGFATSFSTGVDEESRAHWNEPCLPVP